MDELLGLDANLDWVSTHSISPLYSWDAVYPIPNVISLGKPAPKHTFILYADLSPSNGNRKTVKDFHYRLKNLAINGEIRYIYRHYPHFLANNETIMGGYGMALNIKSTEYLAIDDSRKKNEVESSAANNNGNAEAPCAKSASQSSPALQYLKTLVSKGIDWDTLERKLPDSTARKLARSKERIGSLWGSELSDGYFLPEVEKPLQPEDVEFLGIQTANFIMHAAANESCPDSKMVCDPLELLQAVTGDFPSVAPYLALLPVNASIEKEAWANHESGATSFATGIVTINGMQVDTSSENFNIFSVLPTLQKEEDALHYLNALPISYDVRNKIFQLTIHGGRAHSEGSNLDSIVRIAYNFDGLSVLGKSIDEDLRDEVLSGFQYPFVTVLNDFEKPSLLSDALYARWSTKLEDILYPSWQLPSIRRNLYTALFFLPLSKPQSQLAIAQIFHYIAMRLPVRFGVVPLIGDDPLENDQLQMCGLDTAPRECAALGISLDEEATSLQFAMLHTAITLSLGDQGSFAFLHAIANRQREQMQDYTNSSKDSMTVKELISMYEAAWESTKAAVDSPLIQTLSTKGLGRFHLRDQYGTLRRALNTALTWHNTFNVPPLSILINGRIIRDFKLDRELLNAVQEEMVLLQTAVRAKSIDDSVAPSVYHAFIGQATSLVKSDLKKKSIVEVKTQPLPGSGTLVSKYHEGIFASDDQHVVVPMVETAFAHIFQTIPYFSVPETNDMVKSVTFTFIDDFDTIAALESAAVLLASINCSADMAKTTVSSNLSKFLERLQLHPPEPVPVCPFGKSYQESVRVGFLHVASNDEARNATTPFSTGAVGTGILLQSILALVSDHFGHSSVIRRKNRIPLLAVIVDLFRAAQTSQAADRTADSGTRALHLLRLWLEEQSAENDTVRILSVKEASEFLSFIKVTSHDVASATTLQSMQNDTLTYLDSTMLAPQVKARYDDVIRLLSAYLPSYLSTASRGSFGSIATAPAARAFLVNGRLFALASRHSDYQPNAAQVLGRTISLSDLELLLAKTRMGSIPLVESIIVSNSDAFLTFDDDPKYLDSDSITVDYISWVVMAASSSVHKYKYAHVNRDDGSFLPRISLQTNMLATKYSSFQTPNKQSRTRERTAMLGFEVTAILNPVSEEAQRAAPIIKLLRDRLKATIFVHLIPPIRGSHREIPLKSFYRFVSGDQADQFLTKGRDSIFASFRQLPSSLIFFLKPFVPETWNVQLLSGAGDVDNLCFSNFSDKVVFTIKDILLTGQCFDGTKGDVIYPHGLSLALKGNRYAVETHSSLFSDTMVMQNVGYWQLKAQPGVWEVSLAEGKSKELYNILSTQWTFPSTDSDFDIQAGQEEKPQYYTTPYSQNIKNAFSNKQLGTLSEVFMPIRDFYGSVRHILTKKKEGMENMSLLDVDNVKDSSTPSNGFLSQIKSFFSSTSGSIKDANASQKSGKDGDNRPVYHVFSIASGHLYERFLRIMMLSVIKSTPNGRIKFWLVENFLSPEFKATAPLLAQEYGAEVAFVSYKWPHWLRNQSDKQRLIWGYKILFLDVLFPLDVDKVVFIDADQVVRADLKELWDIDLNDAPYAFTPFCTSRQETLGYQFWREGYWKDHLRGKPYHISALFVVDLVRFRQMSAGDTLRAIYDSLSRDPNSLSNLDQDLPNYAQHMIPIHSLPQEWLWCESWCSDDSKAAAKTIDLCNNPRFKEPKLSMARRIIAGDLFQQSWDEMDQEIKDFEQRLATPQPKMELIKTTIKEEL